MSKNVKTTKLVWRLKDMPDIDELRSLVKDEILTKDEAREILFSVQEVKDQKELEDVKALKSEINFLRELVEKLSNKTAYYPVWTTINATPWQNYRWYTVYSSTLGDSATPKINAFHTATESSTTSLTANTVRLPRYSIK